MPRKAQIESLADSHAAPGGAAAVDRALTLLSAFRAGDTSLSLAELASRTQLYKSTVLRLLASLEHARLVQRLDDGSYGLGNEVARLNAVYAASFSLDRVVLPVLRELVAATGESAAYHVRPGRGLACACTAWTRRSRSATTSGPVTCCPLIRGTGARILIAFDTDRARAAAAKRPSALRQDPRTGLLHGCGRPAGRGGRHFSAGVQGRRPTGGRGDADHACQPLQRNPCQAGT